MSEPRVVVTGTGLISVLGDSRPTLHEALCRGQRGLRRVELFDDPALDLPLAGEITDFDPAAYLGERNFRPLDRTSQLLVSAAKLALDDSRWTTESLGAEAVGLVVGTTFCSLRTISSFDRRALEEGPSCASPLDFANTVINAAAGQTGIWHGLRGVNSTISAGATSGLEAIAYAAGLIREGHARAILAGGVEELCVESLLAFQRAGLLLTPDGRRSGYPLVWAQPQTGFVLAEGAALLMLEEFDAAVARGAPILAEVKGAGARFDCALQRQDDEAAARQRAACVADAVGRALDEARLDPADVDALSASANGNRIVDQSEAVGWQQVFNGRLRTLPITAVKSMLGESLGASAALQAVDVVAALGDGRWPGIPGFTASGACRPRGSISHHCRRIAVRNCLLTSVGLDGHCGALVVGAPVRSEPRRSKL
jgi:3-oxoacyl-[acyl-carrier-protein] synthase II